MSTFAVIIAAAGRSRRFNSGSSLLATSSQKKPFAPLKGRAVWLYSAERFARRKDVAQLILVVSPEDRADVESRFAAEISLYGIELVDGGAERFLSVENALKVVKSTVDFVAVHDAARPCVSDADVENVFTEASRSRAAILASPVVGSLKRSRGGKAREKSETELVRERLGIGASSISPVSAFAGTFDDERLVVAESTSRENLWEAQTPQVFARDLLERAYRERVRDFAPTDDCGLVEALGVDVSIVAGARTNIKITTSEDLAIAEKFLEIVARRDTKSSRFF